MKEKVSFYNIGCDVGLPLRGEEADALRWAAQTLVYWARLFHLERADA